MPKPKSIIQRVEIDQQKKAHNCQHNNSHRIQAGEKRLKVREGRSAEHYCTACALTIITHDISKLQELAGNYARRWHLNDAQQD